MKKMLSRLMVAAFAVVCGAAVFATEYTLTPLVLTKAGASTSYTHPEASYGGEAGDHTYKFTNDGKVFIHFKKTGSGTCTVTITTTATVGGLAVADQTVTVAATTGDVMVGPFPTSIFNDASGIMSFVVNETVGLYFMAGQL